MPKFKMSGKLEHLRDLVSRPRGASAEDIHKYTGLTPQTIQNYVSTLRRNAGLAVQCRGGVYRLSQPQQQTRSMATASSGSIRRTHRVSAKRGDQIVITVT